MIVHVGEVITPWNSTQRVVQVALDYPGVERTMTNEFNDTIYVSSSHIVSTNQDYSRIGLGVDWCVSQFILDPLTFTNLSNDSKYEILWSETENA